MQKGISICQSSPRKYIVTLVYILVEYYLNGNKILITQRSR